MSTPEIASLTSACYSLQVNQYWKRQMTQSPYSDSGYMDERPIPLPLWNYCSYDGPRTMNNITRRIHNQPKSIVKPTLNAYKGFMREQAATKVTVQHAAGY